MKTKFFFLVIYFLGAIYLLQPSKPLPFLSEGGVSDEPGDTYQNPTQRGFYTNLKRSQVLSEVQAKLKLSIFNLSLPNYRLNFRPEEAGELVRDQIKSNYLEEIIYPLHSSVFVNGWEPKNAPANTNKPGKEVTDLSLHGVPYNAKVTLKPIDSQPLARIFIWTAIFPASYFVYKSLRLSLLNV